MSNGVEDDLPSIVRNEVEGKDDALVALFPSRESGIEFLQKNESWGFVQTKEEPTFVAIYIGEDIQKISYFGVVKEIVPAKEASLERSPEEYENYESGRKVIHFVQNRLYELEDPIPFKSRVLYPPVRYTTLKDFKSAETMDDLL